MVLLKSFFMRVLIFGCGYLGRRTAQAWIRQGATVFACTRSDQKSRELSQLGIQPLIGDICQPATLRDLPVVDIVLQSVGYDRNSGQTRDQVTLQGMRNVLQQVGRNCLRFIQISSTSVYGQTSGEWVDEESASHPTAEGGQLTLAAEKLVHEHYPAGGPVNATVLRLAGIYGPDRVLARLESLRAAEPIAGNPDSWLNLIYVDDAVSAIMACSTVDAPAGTFNVVDDQPIARRDYYTHLADMVGAPVPEFDTSDASARGSGGLNKRCSNRKLRQLLGWTPRYETFKTGLSAALEESVKG